ncbi:MAG: helix-turn-helix transcriptional regulator [Clostridiales bacterium]|nr:helix-turn-helix transcriptional regulator [Clostridiales bacterium]
MRILLWQVRANKGLTLRQLEELTGISRATLNNIENGKVSPQLDYLEKLAIAMDVRITDLFESDYK